MSARYSVWRIMLRVDKMLFWLICLFIRKRLGMRPQSRTAPYVVSSTRFAVCTRFTPPLWSGQAVVIGRLLDGLDPEVYCLVSLPLSSGSDKPDFTHALPGKRILLPQERSLGLLNRLPWISRLRLFYQIWQRGNNIARALKAESVDMIVGCSGDMLDIPAAYFASRILDCRFVLYFFDDYSEQWWADPPLKKFISRIERLVVPYAIVILTTNEFMQAEIKKRYGRDSTVIHNPRPLGALAEPVLEFPSDPHEIRLVFTGAVYHLNYDILRKIIAAIAALPQHRLRLHIYTAQARAQLEQEGLIGPHVEIHGHLPPDKIAEVQSKADILLIPFSFLAAAKGIVRTAATAKLADYLATGRPILALCPEDCFINWYLTHHDCGIAASSDNADEISSAIEKIVSDARLRERLRHNALQCAHNDFDPKNAQRQLLDAIGLQELPQYLRIPPPAPQAGQLRITQVSGFDLLGIQVNGFLTHKYFQEKGHESRMLVYGKMSADECVHELGGETAYILNYCSRYLEKQSSMNAIMSALSFSIASNPVVRDADIVNLQLIHNAPFFGLLNLPRLSQKKRVVLSVHDMFLMTGHCVYSLDCERWKIGCGNCPDLDIPIPVKRDKTARNWKLKKWIFERSRLDIVVGSRWQEDRVRQSPILSRFPVHNIPYGVDTRIYRVGDKRAARAKLGIPDDAHVIAFRAPLGRNFKGTEYIEAALSAYSPQKRTYLLTFQGRGSFEKLRQKYDFIEFDWVFDQERIALVLRAADIFLMPSTAEAFGLMALESMACGTPVIVFEGTALPEAIDAPNSGIAVPYKDSDALMHAISKCFNNPAYLAELRENGLRHVAAKHTFEAYADAYLALYERLAAEQRH